jgi:hypothetical protein
MTTTGRVEGDRPRFSKELFKSLNTNGYVAESRFCDGLSACAYVIQMVKNKNDPDDQYHPNIVHCGKSGTKRDRLFYSPSTNLVGLDGKPAGTKNNRGLKVFNTQFSYLFQVFEPIFRIDPTLKIPIFTELRKDNKLYRADPCSPHAMEATEKCMTRSWCDWAIFQHERKTEQTTRPYPGQIFGFTSFDSVAAIDAFNETCNTDDKVDPIEGDGYAIATLTSRELVGFFDPAADPQPEQQMQANSSLFFWEQKETVSNSGGATLSAKRRRGKAKSKVAEKPKQCRIRTISINRISSPVVAFKDFGPNFEHKNGTTKCGSWAPDTRSGAYIFVRPRVQWGNVFLSRARQAFVQHKLEQKEKNITIPSNTNNKTNSQPPSVTERSRKGDLNEPSKRTKKKAPSKRPKKKARVNQPAKSQPKKNPAAKLSDKTAKMTLRDRKNC